MAIIRRTASVLVALVVVAGCGPAAPSGSAPETRRGPVSLDGQQVERYGASSLSVTVPSCHGDPELVELDVGDASVRIEVVSTQVVRGDRDDCLDSVTIELDRPLGDREVIDVVSGSALPVGRETAVELTCFDADYPEDPTFATPEEAFADALGTEAEDIGAPEQPETYERHERGEARVEYEVRASADRHLTWGITRDEEGGWGMTSLGGCWPTGP